MKKSFFQYLLAFLFLFLFILFPKNTYAQNCSATCQDICHTLDNSLVALVARPIECTSSNVSFELLLRIIASCGEGQPTCPFNGFAFYDLSSSVYHINSDGDVIISDESSSINELATCNPPTTRSCQSGDSFEITTTNDFNTPSYPDGVVNFSAEVSIEIRDIPLQTCQQGILTAQSSCTIDEELPDQCTPSDNCGGINFECPDTQICTDEGVCDFPEDMSCGCSAYSPFCGGGGCPMTHYCEHNLTGGGFYCVEDPENCHTCSGTSDTCGGECNIFQKCINGWCTDRPLECPDDLGGNRVWDYAMFCDSKEVSSGINTAIGCIPVHGRGLTGFTSFVIVWTASIVGGIALILIVYAGLLISTSSGNPEKVKAGKELLTAAIAGLLLVVFSVFILRIIGVEILKIPDIDL